MNKFKTTTNLNLRSSGMVAVNNFIITLPQGQIVTRVKNEPDSEKWWNVSASIAGEVKTGFVNKSYLVPYQDITGFEFPKPESSNLGKKLNLWATFYFVPEFKSDSNGADLLDVNGNSLGVKLSNKNWCIAAVEGSFVVSTSRGKQTFNFAGKGVSEQIDCRPFFPNLPTVGDTGKSRFRLAKGKYGDGVNNLKLVPFRSIAVDKTKIPIGTVIYIPAARGISLVLPDGENVIHDGYFIKNDHIDVFIGVLKNTPFPFVTSDASGKFEAFIVSNSLIANDLEKNHKK
jgi:3D (Asp-Asp-Asp) domain-containing protein